MISFQKNNTGPREELRDEKLRNYENDALVNASNEKLKKQRA